MHAPIKQSAPLIAGFFGILIGAGQLSLRGDSLKTDRPGPGSQQTSVSISHEGATQNSDFSSQAVLPSGRFRI